MSGESEREPTVPPECAPALPSIWFGKRYRSHRRCRLPAQGMGIRRLAGIGARPSPVTHLIVLHAHARAKIRLGLTLKGFAQMVGAVSIAGLFPPPFYPKRYYYLPQTWLNEVARPAQLDTLDLLFSMLLPDERKIVFPPSNIPEGVETYWTRTPPPGEPVFVSHVSYGNELKRLIAAGRLNPIDKSDQYLVADDGAFEGPIRVYRPFTYRDHRWPHYFGKNAWAPRAALLSCLMALSEHYRRTPGPYSSSLAVKALVSELRQHCRTALPRASVDAQVGEGLVRLAAFDLVRALPLEEGAQSRDDKLYEFKVDALDQAPGWPPQEVARLCSLEPNDDAELIALIVRCLQVVFRPVKDAPKVWDVLRRYRDVLATPADLAAWSKFVEEQGRRNLSGLRTLLTDFAQQQRRLKALPWREGPGFELRLTAADAAHGLRLPVHTTHGVDALQLIIRLERGRTNIEAAQAYIERTYLSVEQGRRSVYRFNRLPSDRLSIRTQCVIACNSLLTSGLRFDEPFSMLLQCEQPPEEKLILCGRFRVRLAAPARQQGNSKSAR